MKTTLDLPDDLMRAIKVRAAQGDRKLKDLVAELLRAGLVQLESGHAPVQHRVQLPLVVCRPADPEAEMTPDRVASALLEEEAGWMGGRDREAG